LLHDPERLRPLGRPAVVADARGEIAPQQGEGVARHERFELGHDRAERRRVHVAVAGQVGRQRQRQDFGDRQAEGRHDGRVLEGVAVARVDDAVAKPAQHVQVARDLPLGSLKMFGQARARPVTRPSREQRGQADEPGHALRLFQAWSSLLVVLVHRCSPAPGVCLPGVTHVMLSTIQSVRDIREAHNFWVAFFLC